VEPEEGQRFLSRESISIQAEASVRDLADDRAFEMARDVLIRIGSEALPALQRVVQDPLRAMRALETIAALKDDRGKRFLLSLLGHRDEDLRGRAARALASAPAENTTDEKTLLRAAIDREIECAHGYRGLERTVSPPLDTEAKADFHRALERLFLLLATLQPEQPFRRTYFGLVDGDPSQRGFALEWLDETLDPFWRKQMVSLLEQDGHARDATLPAWPVDPWWNRLRVAVEQPELEPTVNLALRLRRLMPFRRWRVRDLEVVVRQASTSPGTGRALILRDDALMEVDRRMNALREEHARYARIVGRAKALARLAASSEVQRSVPECRRV
jgi:hypothetical protein